MLLEKCQCECFSLYLIYQQAQNKMKNLKNIDYAFLPMNLPYTMTPEMVSDAAKAFKPKVLYPYHFGNTNTSDLEALMKDTPEVEVRVRNMK